MGDFVKIAAKTALIAVITGAILLVFANVQVPVFNVQLVVNAIGKGRAIVQYYCGPFITLVDIGLWLMGIRYVAIPTLHFSLLAVKWVLKVNE